MQDKPAGTDGARHPQHAAGESGRAAEQTLQNTLANRSPVVSGTSTACDLVEELIRASRGLEVAAQAALTNDELMFIRTTQHAEMGKRLATASRAEASKLKHGEIDSNSNSSSSTGAGGKRGHKSDGARVATNARKRAKRTASTQATASTN